MLSTFLFYTMVRLGALYLTSYLLFLLSVSTLVTGLSAHLGPLCLSQCFCLSLSLSPLEVEVKRVRVSLWCQAKAAYSNLIVLVGSTLWIKGTGSNLVVAVYSHSTNVLYTQVPQFGAPWGEGRRRSMIQAFLGHSLCLIPPNEHQNFTQKSQHSQIRQKKHIYP